MTTLNGAAIRYAEHAAFWPPVMSIWEREELSIMLPAAPYFGWVIYVVLASMHGAVGQEEQKLLGVSAGSYNHGSILKSHDRQDGAWWSI